MRNIIAFVLPFIFFSCNTAKEEGKFTVKGTVQNGNAQQVYLDQVFFSEQAPEILDSSKVDNSKFALSGLGAEQGLYRIRFTNGKGYLFINDIPEIKFIADINDSTLSGPVFTSPANDLLKRFIINMQSRRQAIYEVSERLKFKKANQSAATLEELQMEELTEDYRTFMARYIDTVRNPVAAMFALGYVGDLPESILQKSITGMPARFPGHQGILGIVNSYNSMIARQKSEQQSQKQSSVVEGTVAPDFTMNDTSGKAYSLNQLRGKYVLVDFWASWCGPCRGENPNLVVAHDKYKSKNFTILGVSLDENKAAWVKAILDDRLNWPQVSDLKGWQSLAVPLYGFDGIPYNVLLDPNGKIIARSLRGASLENKLDEVLNKK